MRDCFPWRSREIASLASRSADYGNLTLTVEQQAEFVEEAPEIFLPIPRGFGKNGMYIFEYICLAAAKENILIGDDAPLGTADRGPAANGRRPGGQRGDDG